MSALIFLFIQILVTVLGGSPLIVKIGGKDTILTMVDLVASAHDGILNVGDQEFLLGPTWSLFALKEGREYNLKIWDVAGNCGCSNQICGEDCIGIKGEDCDSNVIDPPLSCVGSTKKGFCWGLVEVGKTQNYTLYNLSHVGNVALTSYGGPAAFYVSPGFTIRSQYQNENYSLNALITGFTPRRQIVISNLRYAESEGRVISLEEFAFLNAKPTLAEMNVHIDASTCPQDGHPVFRSTKVISNLDGTVDQAGFRSYMILRRAKVEKVSSLLNHYILTPNGILEWSSQNSFDIFDPCNQQFLTLQQDRMGNFFVILPATQSLMTQDIICVAINDIRSNIYDLVLYEIKNATSIWQGSDRFRGILTQDYVEMLQLRVTTKSSLLVNLPKSKVEVSFNFETDQPILQVKSSIPVSCQIYLSPICILNLTLTAESLRLTRTIEKSCDHWYEMGGYRCEGLAGNFYPPARFVGAPMSSFTENTTAVEAFSVETISARNDPLIKQPWYLRYLRNFTFFEKFMIMVIAVFLVVSLFHLLHKRKQDRVPKQNSEDEEKQELAKFHLEDSGIKDENSFDLEVDADPKESHFSDRSHSLQQEESEEKEEEEEEEEETEPDWILDFIKRKESARRVLSVNCIELE